MFAHASLVLFAICTMTSASSKQCLQVVVAALEVEVIDELQIETALKPTTASKEDLRFLADSVDSLGFILRSSQGIQNN